MKRLAGTVALALLGACANDASKAPPTTLIGPSGMPSPASLTMVFEQDEPRRPAGLAFHPERPNELWIANYLDGSAIIVQDPGTASMKSTRRRDAAASHFMNRPTGLAFGVANTWATCGDNGGNVPGFMGPTLFSADLSIFAATNATGLGSHLDMLHDSPFCMGIAHEAANVYWVFDGQHASLSRYDFAVDHGPGNDDHSDGVIRRYVEGQLARKEGVPSGMQIAGGMLYVSDTGHQRVVKLDLASGTPGEDLVSNERLVEHKRYDGAALTDVVPPGTLDTPSGLAVHQGVLYVADQATARVHAFTVEGEPLVTLETGLGAGALTGLTVGPDGKLWLLDVATSRVYRVDLPAATE